MFHVEQDLVTVKGIRGRIYRPPSLLGVGLDVDAVILAEEERQAREHEEARRPQA